MPLPPPETQEFIDEVGALQSHTRRELEQSQQQLQEIKLLLNQTASEIEKLTQREMALANRVRDMEVNLDSYSRTDIRTLYNANHEVQLRLFMMRSQAEQLETRQQNIREYQEKLRTILELLQVHADLAQQHQTDRLALRSAQGGSLIPAWQNAVAVIEGQEAERLRLAREIQDGPAQTITNILLRLEVCKQALKYDVDAAQRELDDLKAMLVGTLRDQRRLLASIRPLALEDLGLSELLRRMLGEVGREAGVETSVAGNLVGPVPNHLQVALFRLLQRAISAVLATGRQGRLAVTLQAAPEHLSGQLDVAGALADEARARLEAYLATEPVAQCLEILGGTADVEASDAGQVGLTVRLPLQGTSA
ncbi:MAG TPA: histidine kinase [Thermomicrobiales bacterium]|nr:histidine kinase [Thermomicrobiales bacterium]